MHRGDFVSKKDVQHTLFFLQNTFNSAVEDEQKEVDAKNMRLVEDFCAKKIDVDELAASWTTPTNKIKITSSTARRMTRDFMKAKGLTKQVPNTAGNYLSPEDPKMLEWLVNHFSAPL